jgi:alpha-galactosidase
MLEIGNGGMSETEYRTHMTLWSMLAAPLLAGNDLEHMSPEILGILTNRDVIAIDQDPAGKEATRIAKAGDSEVWMKELAGGAKAIALFNRATEQASVSVKWTDAGFTHAPRRARDLWLHKNVALHGLEYSTPVPAHGAVVLRVPAA